MKRLAGLVLVFLLIMAMPALAIFRELDAETETRLTQIVLDHYQDAEVVSTRILDFWNIERSVLCLVLVTEEKEFEAYVDIESEELLSVTDMAQMEADNNANPGDEPDALPEIPEPEVDGNQPVTEQPAGDNRDNGRDFPLHAAYAAGGLLVLIGGGFVAQKLIRR